MGDSLPPVAVTMGEPAGIGGDITLMTWLRRGEQIPPFFVIDDPGRLSRLADRMGLRIPVQSLDAPGEAAAVFDRALPVLAQPLDIEVAPGRPKAAAAACVIGSIDRAVALVQSGAAAAMVTNPIHKATLYGAGFAHPGHTEYLAERAGLATPPVMMLACSALRVIPVTIHLPLAEAVARLSGEAIVHCGRIAAESLERDFGIARPRIAVAGLNPHAGEDGHLGKEDDALIAPAVARLRAAGIDARGPLPADTMFHAAARESYDVALCMYHDQALIPIKTVDFDGGVNVTLGLPFVRTSPDHGTAFDIAGTRRANPASLMAALRMAGDMARHRRSNAATVSA